MKKESVSIVKIGGNVLENPPLLEEFLSDFHRLEGKKVLIHGGGVMASDIAEKMGIRTQKIEGRRVTDAEMLKVVTMVYAGWLNKKVVALLQKSGCNAVGLSGADSNVIPASKREPKPIDFGFVGDPITEKVNVNFLTQLLNSNIVPVFCAITHNENGDLLNTNADTVAYTVATALAQKYETKLYLCFEKEGVLYDINDNSTLITEIVPSEYQKLKQKRVIVDGMIPKLDNSFQALEKGVGEVMILNAKNLLLKKGTIIKNINQ